MINPKESSRPRVVAALMETFGFNLLVASIVALMMAGVVVIAIIWLVQSAPPRTLTITSGPPGSSFQRFAEAYQKALGEKDVTLTILPSGGSLENLKRLQSPTSGVDIGFVQAGAADGAGAGDLVSLGSVSYQPLWVFYRGTPITRLSELAGKRIGVGAVGSGTHALALTLLTTNGITKDSATLVDRDAAGAATDLLEGKLDAVFLMGDSASRETLSSLVRNDGVHAYSFTQADAYVRRYPFLNKIIVPRGSIDFGKNLPAQDVVLVGPTVELIARKKLNSGVSDLILDAGTGPQGIHGKASLLQKKGEFPAPIAYDFPLSDDAARFYKSGKSMLVKAVGSPWIASFINRFIVAIVPLALLLIPAIRFLPLAYRWRIQLRIYRCYRPLLRLEADAAGPLTHERVKELLERLDEIEVDVNRVKVPASFAYQFYALQGHLAFVRQRLKTAVPAT